MHICHKHVVSDVIVQNTHGFLAQKYHNMRIFKSPDSVSLDSDQFFQLNCRYRAWNGSMMVFSESLLSRYVEQNECC